MCWVFFHAMSWLNPWRPHALGHWETQKNWWAFCGPKTPPTQATNPTFKDISVYCIGSQQWPPTFKQVSHLGIHFLSLGTKKMMLKKCLYTHTHPPANGIPAASTTPIASLSGNTLLLNQCEKTPKGWTIKTTSLMQARSRDASHPKSDSAKNVKRCTWRTVIMSMFPHWYEACSGLCLHSGRHLAAVCPHGVVWTLMVCEQFFSSMKQLSSQSWSSATLPPDRRAHQ